MRTSHLSSSAALACVLKRHSPLMVNDRLRELLLVAVQNWHTKGWLY
jgi:hypothetical protein